MPSTGTPSSNTPAGAPGGPTSVTASRTPDHTMPRGLNARTSASLMSQGWISQYTPDSRMRRAINCVYCAPKSRIRMRSAWMSGGRRAAGARSADTVVRCFLGDRDVVHVTFADTGVRDAHEPWPRAHLLHV